MFHKLNHFQVDWRVNHTPNMLTVAQWIPKDTGRGWWQLRTVTGQAKSACTSLKAKIEANLCMCYLLCGNEIRNVLGSGEGTQSQAELREVAILRWRGCIPLSVCWAETPAVREAGCEEYTSPPNLRSFLAEEQARPFSSRAWKSWATSPSHAPSQAVRDVAAKDTHQSQHLVTQPLTQAWQHSGQPCCRAFLYQLYLPDKIIDLSSAVFNNLHSSPLFPSLTLHSLCCSVVREATGHICLQNKALSS